jgi:ribosomal protein S2
MGDFHTTKELNPFREYYIFHKNREISILTIKKKTARLTLLQEATERTRQGETQNKTKHKKHTAV